MLSLVSSLYNAQTASASAAADTKAAIPRPVVSETKLMKQFLQGKKQGGFKLGNRAFDVHHDKKRSTNVYKCTLQLGDLVTTSAGGLVNTGISVDPTSAGDWGSLSGVFDSYRVTHVIAHYEPASKYQPFSANAASPGAAIIVYDFDNTGTQTWANILQYDVNGASIRAKVVNLGDSWVYKAGTPKDIVMANSNFPLGPTWINTGSPLSFGTLFITSDSNLNMGTSKTLGSLLVQFVTEFIIRQ